jgi:O-antigen/teichoic acid export membrane protein
MGTTVVTSGLGFFYWWLAARQFPAEAVGLGSAAISAMMLLANVSVLGFGTLLIGELPRQPGKEGSLISTALLAVGVAGGGLGLLFAIIAPRMSADLRVLAENAANISLFAVGVSLTAVTLVLDQALVGLLRGDLQLWRNTIFAVVKLVALIIVGLWLSAKVGFAIYTTWLGGNIISLAALAGYATLKNNRGLSFWPQWKLLTKLGSAALQHHILNLTLQASGMMMPIIVTAMLSARMNAYFYTSWMIASFAAVAPMALTTVLYAVGSADPGALANKIRLTLRLSALAGILTTIAFLWGADIMLRLFKAAYAEQASLSLRILGLAVFPLIIKNHFVVIHRIYGRVTKTALWMAAGGLLELILAATGAALGGLAGLSVGWVTAMSIEALFMARTVYQVAVPASN